MEYVIIVGASIDNIGSESMTCIAIEMAKKKFPNAEIVLASTDKKGAQRNIKYKIHSYFLPTNLRINCNSAVTMALKRYLDIVDDLFYAEILDRTRLIIDISGYVFTTKFGKGSMAGFLNNIYIAKCYKIPYLVMQQSFGPIYIEKKKDQLIFKWLMSTILKYPKMILARETDGYQLIRRYTKRNVEYRPDMVLLYGKKIDYDLLRNESYEKKIKIASGSVAIVPNQKIIEKTNIGNDYIDILVYAANKLMDKGIRIYIVCHCGLDKDICRDIQEKTRGDIEIIDCTDQGGRMFDEIIREMRFAIASRYHSIVHMYRQGVPSIVLGWEEKYNELLKLMNQTDYLYDCRNRIDINRFNATLEKMISNYELENTTIRKRLVGLRDEYKQC